MERHSLTRSGIQLTAASFLTLVQHLKDQALLKALGMALRDPAVVRHLGMPIAARLRRLARPLGHPAT